MSGSSGPSFQSAMPPGCCAFRTGSKRAGGARAGPSRKRLLTSPMGELAPHLLDRRWRDVRKRSKRFGRLTARQRHKLRIAAKKLRYTMELLGSLFDQNELQDS